MSSFENFPDDLARIQQDRSVQRIVKGAFEQDPRKTAASLVRIVEKKPLVAEMLVRVSFVDQEMAQALERGVAADPALARELQKVRADYAAMGVRIVEDTPLQLANLEQDEKLRILLLAALEHDPQAAAAPLARAMETNAQIGEDLVRFSLIDQDLAQALEKGAVADPALARSLDKLRPQVEADCVAQGLAILERDPGQLISLKHDRRVRRMVLAALEHEPETATASLSRAITSARWIAEDLVKASLIDQEFARALERGAAEDPVLAHAFEQVRPKLEAEAAYEARGLAEKGIWLVNVLAKAPTGVLSADEELARKLIGTNYGRDIMKTENSLFEALKRDPQATAASLARALERRDLLVEHFVLQAAGIPGIAEALIQASKVDQSVANAVERVPGLRIELERTQAATQARKAEWEAKWPKQH